MAKEERAPAPQPEPGPEPEPTTIEDYIRRAWSLHVNGELSRSEADFRQALSMDPQSVEALYGIGLSLKLQRRAEQAVEFFQKAVQMADAGSMSDDRVRASMLRQMSDWHIKTIQSGMAQEPEP